MQLAPLAQADGHFDPGTLQLQVEGNQGQAFLIQQATQLVDFPPVGQQFAHPQRVVVEVAAGMAVGGDVYVVQQQLTVADQTEAIPQIGLPGTDRFHFRTHQLDPGLEGVENLVLVPGQAIVCQETIGCSTGRGGGFFCSSLPHVCASIFRPYTEVGTLPAWQLCLPALASPIPGHK